MGDPEEADLGGGWRARWDDDALYLHVDVVDDQEAVDSAELYNDDLIEVYVDADYSNLPSYDGQNDFQIVAARGADGVSAGVLPNDLSPEMAWNETDDGYELEIAFQWSNLAPDQTIEPGHVLGFDVHVNDDDGSDRDKKLTWFNEQDDSWENPSAFAAVELTE